MGLPQALLGSTCLMGKEKRDSDREFVRKVVQKLEMSRQKAMKATRTKLKRA
jgi:hypothetical protein